jgi:hypothetical protein
MHDKGKSPKSKENFCRDRCYDFLNIFAVIFCKKWAFLTQNKVKFFKKLIITLVFEKNANFCAENWEKSQKIVIITSTPGLNSCHFKFSSRLQATRYF